MTTPPSVRWGLQDGLRATLPAWLLAHLVTLALCRQLSPSSLFDPLSVWDTHWYLAEAQGMAHGGAVFADQTGPGGLAHFFPLTSLATAGITIVTRLPTAFVLFAFCWVMALLFGALVHMIAMQETGNEGTARRAAWLSQLTPGAFALVLGYTEPLAGVLAAAFLLCVRRARPDWAFAYGLLAGVSRPTGVVLGLPAAIEAVRAAHRARWSLRSVLTGLAQSLSPALGLGFYLWYCRLRFGDWILPYSQQVSGGNRGAVLQNPIETVRAVLQYPQNGPAILTTSIACAVIAVVALIACWRRLPVSYTAWSAVMLVLGVTSPWFTSEPRYLAAVFPLSIALAAVLRSRWLWYPVLAVNLVLYWWVAWLALTWRQVA